MSHSVVTPEPGRAPYLRELALALFDGAAEAHRLPPAARRLLQIAADYYDAARRPGQAQPERTGRDLVLLEPIAGLTPAQQSVVASVVAFQRDKLRRAREPAFLRLGQADQQLALQLAAVLHLATALEGRGPHEFWFGDDGGAPALLVGGGEPERAAALAAERAERWHQAIGALTVRCVTPADQVRPIAPAAADAPEPVSARAAAALAGGVPARLSGEEPMAEACRRLLRRQFERMLAREEDVCAGEDPEDVHQMRVATRRLRASLQITAPLYSQRTVARFRRGLRRAARALGLVRDRDVFLEHVLAYQAGLPEDRRAALEPLLARVGAERAEVRRDLLAELGSRRYGRFKLAFAAFLSTPGAEAAPAPETGRPLRVRDRAGSMLWQRYEDWRAFEVLLPDASDPDLHAARIAGKRLRYTIELFADGIGPRAEELLAPLTLLQECLGAIQDAVVAAEHIHALGMDGDPGAQSYLAARREERARSGAELPRLWEKVASATYRRKLFEAIARL